MAFKDKVKAVICGSKLDPGDQVRVPGATWEDYAHPEAGAGKFAIYLGTKGQKALVRPLDEFGNPQKKAVEVERVEVLRDVLFEQWQEEKRAKLRSARAFTGNSNGNGNGKTNGRY